MRTSGLSAKADNRHEVPREDDFNRLKRNQVRRYGQLLYCQDDRLRVRFQTEALRDYLDTRPIWEVQRYYLVKRIREGR